MARALASLTVGAILKAAIPCVAVLSVFYLRKYHRARWTALVHGIDELAKRRWPAIGLITILPIAFRLALLPWVPIPEPRIHDEFTHLLVADTLASGRLSNPTHPLWIHFEAPYVLHEPAYAGSYPPGQGAVLALAKWLTGTPWIGVLIIAGLMCGGICWALQKIVEPMWAVVGGLVSFFNFALFEYMPIYGAAYWVNSYWGGAAAALGGALLFGSLVRLFDKIQLRSSLLFAAGYSMVFLIRPFEAIVLGLATAPVLLVRLWRSGSVSSHDKMRYCVLPIAAVLGLIFSAALYYNYRVTGDPMTHPYQLTRKLYGVPQAFYWQTPIPAPPLRYKSLQDLYNQQLEEYASFWSAKGVAERIEVVWSFFFGFSFSVPLLALWSVRIDRQMQSLIGIMLAGLIGIMLYPFYSPHYSAPYAFIFVLLIVMGMRSLARWTWRGTPAGTYLVVAVLAAATAPSLGAVGRLLLDGPVRSAQSGRPYVAAQLEKTTGRHLVFVRYRPDHNANDEWVYNAASIDVAPIVWAREWTASSNEALMRYFSDRFVWIVDADKGWQPPLIRVRSPISVTEADSNSRVTAGIGH